MPCEDKNIKEFLPAYRDDALELQDKLWVEQHLDSCADCRSELSLLRLMVEDNVPDPGETFWSTMPARVYNAVQAEQLENEQSYVARFWALLKTYRLTAAAAAIGIVVMLAWFSVRPPMRGPEASLSERYGDSDDVMVADAERVNELDPDELEAVGTWVNTQMASLSEELANMPANVISEQDIHDEIIELNANQIERLSTMLNQWKQEG